MVGVLAAPARSATVSFAIDTQATTVAITNQSGGGVACWLTSCGVEANIALNLPSSPFSLDVGQSHTFDFITWTADGSTGLTPRNLTVSASLAFTDPAGTTTTSGGSGSAFFISGVFTAGVLTWADVPATITLGNLKFSVDFQDGLTILPLVGQITTQATVTLLNADDPEQAPVATPLPLTAPLFVAGLGVIGLMSRRRKRRRA